MTLSEVIVVDRFFLFCFAAVAFRFWSLNSGLAYNYLSAKLPLA